MYIPLWVSVINNMRNSNNNKKSNLENLLDGTPRSFYWAGLLMADGHTNNRRIKLALSEKDWGHIKDFGKFINFTGHVTPNKFGSLSIAVMDTDIVPKIRNKFGFRDNKTENPPLKLPHGNDANKFSFIIGFIDGDGSVSTPSGHNFCNIRVKVHGSWLPMLLIMADFVYDLAGQESGRPHINNCGYAEWTISNSIVVRFMKNRAEELNLPIMQRKWGKINLTTKSRYELAGEKAIKIKNMAGKGMYLYQIARALNVHPSGVLQTARKNNIFISRYKKK